MTREVNVELINNGNKWITTVIKLVELDGIRRCIKVITPPNEFLLKPNKKHSSKVYSLTIKSQFSYITDVYYLCDSFRLK